MGRNSLAGILLCALGVGASAQADGPVNLDPIPGVREYSGRLIARPIQIDDAVASGMDAGQAQAAQADARKLVQAYANRSYVWQTDEYLFDVPAGATEALVIAQLMATGTFQYVEPDWIVFPIACPNDDDFGQQWHHASNRLNSCAGWDIETGDPSVAIGICDTGVRTTHSDLLLHRLEGYNAVNQVWESQGGQINDINGHGTMTTGCAAANGNNSNGVSGVGWNLSHRMLRVSNSGSGSSSLSVLQHAARTAAENGDRAASISYSGVDSNSNLTTATYVKSIGGLMVWAAGNESRNLTLSQRDSDDLIVVGGTNRIDRRAYFSNYGRMVDVVAPATNVYTTQSGSNSDYGPASGTSFACPLTAGLIGVIWSADPSLTPDQVETILKNGCDDLGSGGVDDTYGYGRIDVRGSLMLVD